MVELGGRLDFTQEPVAHAGPLDQMTADHLEHLRPSHQLVLGQVDHAHSAAAELANDLVVRVIDKASRVSWARGAHDSTSEFLASPNVRGSTVNRKDA